MITFIFITIALITAWADYRAYRKTNLQSIKSKIALAIALIILNILPIISIIITALSKDNTQAVMNFASWNLTIYTIATLTRMGFYISFLTIRQRGRAAIVGSIIAAAIFAILCNSLINTRTSLVIKNVSITNNKIPESFDGFRIALFSDLHIGSLLNPEREIKALAEAINNQKPAMVLFAGDLLQIRHTEITPKIAQIL